MQAEDSVKQSRTTAIWVGSLYLSGFVIGLLASTLTSRAAAALQPSTSMMMAAGALLWMLASMGDFAHGVLMFRVLRIYRRSFAIAYVGARTLQAGMMLVSSLFILLQIPLLEKALSTAVSNTSQLHLLRDLCVAAQTYAYHMAMMVLAVAGLVLCYAALKSRLFTRSMALWGLLGYAIFLLGSILEILNVQLHLLHTVVGGLWELSMGFVLIFSGFAKPTVNTELGVRNGFTS